MRHIVGYERYDTPNAVTWLNQVYAYLDIYVNLFLPMRKVVAKKRQGAYVRKTYDTARTPLQRLIDAGILDPHTNAKFQRELQAINPLVLHRQLEELLAKGYTEPSQQNQAVH
ncbi:hypothetical protein [Thermanaeromonas sp. C210]|uniref:hypothetical protein n=1 Tax=Thermanaeromonas sp. C210 TaxID=2731925 RepID=UPI00155CDF1B|nr:hypothetical protein [Thermanaeromonas sp. C210]GFN24006.1 hypothetical protein TAMC210_23230 [Thermanaeromonas sp. C210]